MRVGRRLILTGVDGSVVWAESRPDRDSVLFLFKALLLTVKPLKWLERSSALYSVAMYKHEPNSLF